MTYKERKILLLNEGWSIQALADAYTKKKKKPCSREEMSQCIRGVRLYPALRQFLAEIFNKNVSDLFEAAEVEKAA